MAVEVWGTVRPPSPIIPPPKEKTVSVVDTVSTGVEGLEVDGTVAGAPAPSSSPSPIRKSETWDRPGPWW